MRRTVWNLPSGKGTTVIEFERLGEVSAATNPSLWDVRVSVD